MRLLLLHSRLYNHFPFTSCHTIWSQSRFFCRSNTKVEIISMIAFELESSRQITPCYLLSGKELVVMRTLYVAEVSFRWHRAAGIKGVAAAVALRSRIAFCVGVEIESRTCSGSSRSRDRTGAFAETIASKHSAQNHKPRLPLCIVRLAGLRSCIMALCNFGPVWRTIFSESGF